MEIKKLINNSSVFIIKRFIEIYGLTILFLGILLFVSLATYSPEDPNFIFPEKTKIKNLLGFRGSFVADFFFQSFGIISILFSISIFITGINIIKSKKIFLFFKNLFYIILFTLLGSLFFSTFYLESFLLPINGSGGFIGN